MATEVLQSGPPDGDDPFSAPEIARDPDTLPTADDPSGLCPRCGRISNFAIHGNLDLRPPPPSAQGVFRRATERVTVLNCMACQLGTAVIEIKPPNSSAHEYRRAGILWWPTPGALTEDTRSDVPPEIAAAYEEGVRCIGALAPTAAVTMFRNAIAQIVNKMGSDEAKLKLLGTEKKFGNLSSAIKQMADDRTLHDSFSIQADHVREVGNAGAHQETYEAISIQQAREVQELVGAMVDALFVQPAKWSNRMPATKKSQRRNDSQGNSASSAPIP